MMGAMLVCRPTYEWDPAKAAAKVEPCSLTLRR
jgi:hypothetical protein